MGQVQITYKKDLASLITYPGNHSRRYRLKKISGVINDGGKKAKQLCKWWMADHGIPSYARIMFVGHLKTDSLYQIDWDNSLDDIKNGKYHSSHFWKFKDKNGLYNLMRPEHWYGCDRCQ